MTKKIKLKNNYILVMLTITFALGAFLVFQSTQKSSVPEPNRQLEKSEYVESMGELNTPLPKNYELLNSQGDILITDNPDFRIIYSDTTKLYSIYIYNPSFDNTRKLAENEFIDLLNIDKNEACRLNVKLSTPEFANPERAGQIFGLSFCERE